MRQYSSAIFEIILERSKEDPLNVTCNVFEIVDGIKMWVGGDGAYGGHVTISEMLDTCKALILSEMTEEKGF